MWFAEPYAIAVSGLAGLALSVSIAAAAETKSANNSARIGVHGASEKGDVSRGATTSMADVAKALDVPWSIIRRMINTPPGEVEWLSLADLRLMGTKVQSDK